LHLDPSEVFPVRRTRTPRGFTLIELVIVVAVIGLLAAVGAIIARNSTKNANVSGSAYDLATRLMGIRPMALADGVDYYVVVLDAQGNDASTCGWLDRAHCVQYVLLKNVVTASFSLATFDPNAGISNAELVDRRDLPKPIRFMPHTSQIAYTRAPFTGVNLFDTTVMQTCANSRACFMLRFDRNGDVYPVQTASGVTTITGETGFAAVLGNDLPQGQGDQKGVLVSFPAGIVRSFPW
jgi:prepilin-type N-terminal cleavage/methylation domain-containing protein